MPGFRAGLKARVSGAVGELADAGKRMTRHADPADIRSGGGDEVAAKRAEELWRAMLGFGTDEAAVFRILRSIGRPPGEDAEMAASGLHADLAVEEWTAVCDAYRDAKFELRGEEPGELCAHLCSELSGLELERADALLRRAGVAQPGLLLIDGEDATAASPADALRDAAKRMTARGVAGVVAKRMDERMLDTLGRLAPAEWEDAKGQFSEKWPNEHGGDIVAMLRAVLSTVSLQRAAARLRRNGVADPGLEEGRDGAALGDALRLARAAPGGGTPPWDSAVRYTGQAAGGGAQVTVWVDDAVAGAGGAAELSVEVTDDMMADADAARGVATELTLRPCPLLAKAFYDERAARTTPTMLRALRDQVRASLSSSTPQAGRGQSKRVAELLSTSRDAVVRRAVVLWEYSVAGTLVTGATGADLPYHAVLRVWACDPATGEHRVWQTDRTEKGVLWKCHTPPAPGAAGTAASAGAPAAFAAERADDAFRAGVSSHTGAIAKEKGNVVMLAARAAGAGDAGAAAVPDQLCNVVPQYESGQYTVGRERVAVGLAAEQEVVLAAPPTIGQLIAGMHRVAAVRTGRRTYLSGYHPRSQNCQAYVYDLVRVLLSPRSQPDARDAWDAELHRCGPNTAAESEAQQRLREHLVQDPARILDPDNSLLGTTCDVIASNIML